MGEGGVGWMTPTGFTSLSLYVFVVVEQPSFARPVFDGADDTHGADGVESVRIPDNHGVETGQRFVLPLVVGDVLDDVHHFRHFVRIVSLRLEEPLDLADLLRYVRKEFPIDAVVQPCGGDDDFFVPAFLFQDFLRIPDDPFRMLMVVPAMVLG